MVAICLSVLKHRNKLRLFFLPRYVKNDITLIYLSLKIKCPLSSHSCYVIIVPILSERGVRIQGCRNSTQMMFTDTSTVGC